ncbi:ABC transporter ATP-binding protein [Geomesophilobacter sediminis]|uniref:ABC transporter ATP-binding protein n=1 Tax=Geomesophilobacter sediminis TaxID=2798584 RepID=A0A8J7IMN3_9BACT|nr:ABC transporter ATP-binding protein [Geomesophilobacter sediminis]MBJ6724083.1 ABC transporter ATP-binding protein [Geomesophilobacter sediminis]
MNALDIQNLSRVYKGKKGREVQALSGLNLTIGQGEVFGFLGPNGAGKSTTIKTVTGQIRPTEGMAYVFGTPVAEASGRMRIGYLPENPSFYDFMTAREYLLLVGRTFRMPEDRIAAETVRVLNLLELEEAADRPMRGYSKGMVQRLGLAQALLHDPDLYILDEPMSGLDPLGRALVKRVIKELKEKGKTVFFSTHIINDVEVICDRLGVINKGRLLAVDSVANVLERGAEGYLIQISHHGTTTEEVFIPKDRLKAFMAEMVASDASIERIEPMRKDLEEFFLGLVRGGDDAARQ